MSNRVRKIKPTQKKAPQRKVGRAKPVLDALRDVPDIRDQLYNPTLTPLPAVLPAPRMLTILNQGNEGACTGFALAAVVNFLRVRKGAPKGRSAQVSPYMLYQMAKEHDEWKGSGYEGSSLRGALRGFYNCGVCGLKLWPDGKFTTASLAAGKDARQVTLGAYYRLRPHLPDYHAAISETGIVYVSAAVHGGWDKPVRGRIAPGAGEDLHAFAVVGYDADGFWVQNSWGKSWGKGGLAHWPYQDWAANIQDAWVLQLAVPAPVAFGLGVKRGQVGATATAGSQRQPPLRSDILGHFAHVENGSFSAKAPYWTKETDVAETAQLLAMAPDDKYTDFLFYAHGGLNTPEDAATRTAAMLDVFMSNGIYPYSVLYDTGLAETLKDVISQQGAASTGRTGGFLDFTDYLIEKAIGGIGTRLWREMKGDATLPFQPQRDGETAIGLFVDAFMQRRKTGKSPIRIHLVGHSTGAILLGNLLGALEGLAANKLSANDKVQIASCSLMAPACTIDFYKETYRPRLGPAAATKVKINSLTLYNLTDAAEQDDTVTPFYRKSLLYLVSDAFEEAKKMPLLGMQNFDAAVVNDPLKIWYANTQGAPSKSTSHGGFDNDPDTMNGILRTILGKAPKRPFTKQDLDY